jgi:hypothetical protein
MFASFKKAPEAPSRSGLKAPNKVVEEPAAKVFGRLEVSANSSFRGASSLESVYWEEKEKREGGVYFR